MAGKPSPPLRRARPVRLRFPLRCELVEAPRIPTREPIALRVGPPLELGRRGNEKSVEKGPAIERDRARKVATSREGFELQDVYVERGSVDAHLIARGDQEVLPQLLSQPEERIGQEVPSPFRIFFGPQIRDELVAAEPAISDASEQREEREPAPLELRSR